MALIDDLNTAALKLMQKYVRIHKINLNSNIIHETVINVFIY